MKARRYDTQEQLWKFQRIIDAFWTDGNKNKINKTFFFTFSHSLVLSVTRILSYSRWLEMSMCADGCVL